MDLKLKKGQYSKAFIFLWGIIDICCIYVSNHLIFQHQVWSDADVIATSKTTLTIFTLSWLASSILSNAYLVNSVNCLKNILNSVFRCFLYSSLISIFFLTNIHQGWYLIQHVIEVCILFVVLAFSVRVLLLLLYQLSRNAKQNQTRYIIIGYSPSGQKLYKHFKTVRKPGYVFLGFFDDHKEDHKIEGKIKDIADYCLRNDVNQIFYALPDNSELIEDLINFADNNFIHFGLVQDFVDVQCKKVNHLFGDSIPIIMLNRVS